MIVPLAGGGADSTAAPRRVAGRVVRGTRDKQLPVPSQWVILHRVGPDRAGPLDSTRTGADGRYAMRYRPSGDSTAIYFVSTSYGGVAYFTSPLRAAVVTGDDASLTVFDTTSAAVPIKVGGRHLVVGAPRADGARPVVEVFDLQNDSTVTLIARDSASPVWSTHLPDGAVDFEVNPSGNVAAGAVSRHGTTVGLFVPISPGIRQFAYTYNLPQRAFPLTLPLEHATDVVEVLLEEPTARVQGTTLREVSPVSDEGRVFRRYLAQNAPATTVLHVDVPVMIGAGRQRVYEGVGAAVVGAMLVALVFAARRSRPRLAVARAAPSAQPPAQAKSHSQSQSQSESQSLVRAIADLDAAFERLSAPDADARAEYAAKRSALKQQLSDALASDRTPS